MKFRKGDKVIVDSPFSRKVLDEVEEEFNKDKIKLKSGAIVNKGAVKKFEHNRRTLKKGSKVHVKFKRIGGLLDDVELDGIVVGKTGSVYIIISNGNKYIATEDEIKEFY